AEKIGIMIPRFCYHPALGSVGACRMCAVKFLQGPVKGVQMSCMVEATDDMVVSTTDEDAVDFRRHVIEWLMLNHPHDCPVCDEGGHCLLQDMTVSGGHGIRNYLGNKRTHRDQYLGPLIEHEMNRCIQCYRCTRYYQEFSGYRDLGVMRIGNRVYFGRYKEGSLESPFSGNLIDICPTGVYTDKPSRFKGRRWDYERNPSICIHCSLGCHTTSSVRYRQLIRQESRFSNAVNGYFICDRGRYGFYYADAADRPRYGQIDGKKDSHRAALQHAEEKLDRISRNSGPGSIACVGSVRSSIETLAVLKHLCQLKGWQIAFFLMNSSLQPKIATAVSRLEPKLKVSLQEVEQADFILAVGVDPVNEAPMLALSMRQAQQRGAPVIVIDPRPVRLPFEFEHLPALPEEMPLYVGLLAKCAIKIDTATGMENQAKTCYDSLPDGDLLPQALIDAVAPALKQSIRPVIVCGMEVGPETMPAMAADFALLLQNAKKQAGLFYVLPGANAFGAALLSKTDNTFEKVLSGIEEREIRALVLIESDPLLQYPDRQRVERAFDQLDLLVVMDYLSTSCVHRADVFVPTETVFEAGGIFMNQEGRAQRAVAAYKGGPSIDQSSNGNHPPRIFQKEIPVRESKAAWKSLAVLAGASFDTDNQQNSKELRRMIVDAHPIFACLPAMDKFPDEGVRLPASDHKILSFTTDCTIELSRSGQSIRELEILLVDWTFGTEELSAYSPNLSTLQPVPRLFIQSADARQLNLKDGDTVMIQTGHDTLSIQLCVKDRMASGVLVLPRHQQLNWQILRTGQTTISVDQIRKAR
ncbi:MAG: NADH-quinone oxidoreductase subunit NuoG, partial [Desulfobacterales bacterium]